MEMSSRVARAVSRTVPIVEGRSRVPMTAHRSSSLASDVLNTVGGTGAMQSWSSVNSSKEEALENANSQLEQNAIRDSRVRNVPRRDLLSRESTKDRSTRSAVQPRVRHSSSDLSYLASSVLGSRESELSRTRGNGSRGFIHRSHARNNDTGPRMDDSERLHSNQRRHWKRHDMEHRSDTSDNSRMFSKRFSPRDRELGAATQRRNVDWFSCAARTRALEQASKDRRTSTSTASETLQPGNYPLFAGGDFHSVTGLMPPGHWASSFVAGVANALQSNPGIPPVSKKSIIVDTILSVREFDEVRSGDQTVPNIHDTASLDAEDASEDVRHCVAA